MYQILYIRILVYRGLWETIVRIPGSHFKQPVFHESIWVVVFSWLNGLEGAEKDVENYPGSEYRASSEVERNGNMPKKGTMTMSQLHPCMVYLPTFTIHWGQMNVGKYTIHGWYGMCTILVTMQTPIAFRIHGTYTNITCSQNATALYPPCTTWFLITYISTLSTDVFICFLPMYWHRFIHHMQSCAMFVSGG